jgi:hypothetical protein
VKVQERAANRTRTLLSCKILKNIFSLMCEQSRGPSCVDVVGLAGGRAAFLLYLAGTSLLAVHYAEAGGSGHDVQLKNTNYFAGLGR